MAEKVVSIKIPEELFSFLSKESQERGISIDELVSRIISRYLGEEAYIDEKIAVRLERKVQDVIMPFTTEIDNMKRQIAQIVEAIDELQSVCKGSDRRHAEKRDEKRQRSTAIDILEEQGVVFEEDLDLKNPDAFFAKLEREGAKVVRLRSGRIAIHPNFLEEFSNEIEKIDTNDLKKATSKLTTKKAELFLKLVAEGLLYFDENKKKWVLLI